MSSIFVKKSEIQEAKSLRWLANMFPFIENPEDNEDRMSNAIHVYCSAGAKKLEEYASKDIPIIGNCAGCKKNEMGNLIKKDDLGNWGVKGLPWKNLYAGQEITQDVYEKLYGCLWKLMEYESTGLTPEQVESLLP